MDALLSPPEKWHPPEPETKQEYSYSTGAIIAVAVIGVWTLALTAFVALWLADIICWQIFAAALPVSILTYMVLICVFGRTRQLKFVVAVFVLSIFVTAYLLFHSSHPWQIFLVAILAEVIVFLSFRIRSHPRRSEQHRKTAE